MIKISEILKIVTGSKKNGEQSANLKGSLLEKKIIQPAEPKSPLNEKEEEKTNPPSDLRISNTTMRILSDEETIKLYEKTCLLLKEIFEYNKDKTEGKFIVEDKAIMQVEKIVDQLMLGNKKLLMLSFAKDVSDTQYIYRHSVNVAIYSVEIGIGLDYKKSNLMELGLISFLHDIGMKNYLHLIHKPEKLTFIEFNEVKKHIMVEIQVLNTKHLDNIIGYNIFQHHERMDGSGYPLGLKKKNINNYAKIIGVMDVYEAMTHQRVYRGKFTSLKAIENILNSKDQYEHELIKILIERIGLFPLGSLVRLSNKETAQVVKFNPENPLRPVVEIIYNAEGKKSSEKKIIDLAASTTINIKGEEKIEYNQADSE